MPSGGVLANSILQPNDWLTSRRSQRRRRISAPAAIRRQQLYLPQLFHPRGCGYRRIGVACDLLYFVTNVSFCGWLESCILLG